MSEGDAEVTGDHGAGAAAAAEPPVDRDGWYGWLLVLVVVCVVTPLLVPPGPTGAASTVVLQLGTVLVAAEAAGVRGRARRLLRISASSAALVLVLAAASAGRAGLNDALVADLGRAAAAGLVVVVPVLVVRDVARDPRIGRYTVAAALSVYLLLGLGFAFVHALASSLDPEAYTVALGDPDAIYLSFVTLTTVGFGDIAPVGGAARALVVLEAIVGQLYLVSVVAAVVGNLGRVRHLPRPRDGGPTGPAAR